MKPSGRTEGFIIGVLASLTAVIVWDLVKVKYMVFKTDVKQDINPETDTI